MKIQVSQDTLRNYLKEHNITFSILAERMGVSVGIVSGCFNHKPNRLGKPLKFSAVNLERLNAALPQIADELKGCILTFGSDQTYSNPRGVDYDPALIEHIKRGISKYFKLNTFCERVLGWKVGKKESVLCQPASKAYGHITKEDVDRLNAELLSVAGVLSSYEVVPDSDAINTDAINQDKP